MERYQPFKRPQFKRLTGVIISTFGLLVNAINSYSEQIQKRGNSGRKSNLCTEDKLLLTLMYLREYRAIFNIGTTYGLSESNVCRTIRFIELAILQSPHLRLPGKRVLTQAANNFEVVLIDVAESPVERPKKNKENITPVKRKDTLLKHK